MYIAPSASFSKIQGACCELSDSYNSQWNREIAGPINLAWIEVLTNNTQRMFLGWTWGIKQHELIMLIFFIS